MVDASITSRTRTYTSPDKTEWPKVIGSLSSNNAIIGGFDIDTRNGNMFVVGYHAN